MSINECCGKVQIFIYLECMLLPYYLAIDLIMQMHNKTTLRQVTFAKCEFTGHVNYREGPTVDQKPQTATRLHAGHVCMIHSHYLHYHHSHDLKMNDYFLSPCVFYWKRNPLHINCISESISTT